MKIEDISLSELRKEFLDVERRLSAARGRAEDLRHRITTLQSRGKELVNAGNPENGEAMINKARSLPPEHSEAVKQVEKLSARLVWLDTQIQAQSSPLSPFYVGLMPANFTTKEAPNVGA